MRKLLRVLCIAAAVGFGGLAVLETFAIVAHAAGFIGVFVGFFVLPITCMAAPIYEIVKYGNWWPIVVVYGGVLSATVLAGIGTTLRDAHNSLKGSNSAKAIEEFMKA